MVGWPEPVGLGHHVDQVTNIYAKATFWCLRLTLIGDHVNTKTRIHAALVAAAIALGGAYTVGTASVAQAAARNGVCEAGEFCYYFNSNQQGSVSDFTGSLANYGDKQPSCYEFKGAGKGQGKCIKNKAASVWNRSGQTVRVYFNSNYGGTYQSIAPGAKVNLISTLKNNNASHQFISKSTPTKKVTVYLQTDERWSAFPYGQNAGKTATIGSSGCGLLAMTNAVYYLNGKFLPPKTLATFALNNGLRPAGGTSHAFPQRAAQAFGPSYGFKYVRSTVYDADLKAHLKSGGVAVALVPGHFIAIVDYNPANNTFLVLDSYPTSSRGTTPNGDWKTQYQIDNGALKTTQFFLLAKR